MLCRLLVNSACPYLHYQSFIKSVKREKVVKRSGEGREFRGTLITNTVLLRPTALDYFHIAKRLGQQTWFPVGEEEEHA